MVGIIGIFVSLALLIYLAERGWNVIFVAPICATVAILFNWGDLPVLASYTQIYMPALGSYFATYFPLFMLGAVFGKLMDESGSARAIAHAIVGWVGGDRAILAVVLACALLTYGGVSLFVVAFSVYPIAASLFREAAIPKRLIPAAIGLGSFTFTMVALPGTPAIQNAIPIPFFKTTIYAAPGMGLVAAVFMFAAGMLWLNRRAHAARAGGEGYGEHEEDVAAPDTSNLPSFFVALLPILLVIALNFVLSKYVIPAFDHSYLATAKFKNIDLKKVLAIWAIVGAMATAIVVIIAMNRSRIRNLAESINVCHVESCAAITCTRNLGKTGVAKAIECGRLLCRQRECVPGGEWRAWLRQNCPRISVETVRCYMRFARDSHKIDLGCVTTLRRAYQLTGALLPPVAERCPGPQKPTVEFVRSLDQFRLWFNRRTRSLPLRRWSPEARRHLRNELAWFKKLHDQLSEE